MAMLILQIALGIVLAVIILAFLPQILALGAVVIVLGLGLILLGAAMLFFKDKPEILFLLIGFVIALGVGYGISESIHLKRPHLDMEDIYAALAIAAIWIGWAYFSIKEQDYSGIATVIVLGIIGLFSLVRWNRRAYAKWQATKQNATNKESSL